MKLFKSMFMLVAILIIFTLSLMGCGGGSGGGGISYTGLTTPATINAQNAVPLATGAYFLGEYGVYIPFSVAPIEEDTQNKSPRALIIAHMLEKSLRSVEVPSLARGDSSFSAVVTDSSTIFGNCGGSATYTITVNDITGDFNGTYNFNSYCEDDVTASGFMSFSGIINLSNFEFIHLHCSFNNLVFVIDGESFAIAGTLSYSFSTAVSMEIDMDIYVQYSSTGTVYWANNYAMTLDEGTNYIQCALSGKYYDPDYGYVMVSTPIHFVIYNGDYWPTDGILIITGDGGAMARLTVLSGTEFQVEADTNGDGTYNWDSGVLEWDNF
ncbi:MAG: hypothetical protein SVW57_04580 [Thermodesulfobacteriota bacterium]|nr:hypothetical protein [Thermodesulfobacteriota bacterium]